MAGLVLACPTCGKDIVDIPGVFDLPLDAAVELFEKMVKDAGAVIVDGQAYCDSICHEAEKRGGRRVVQ